MRVGCTCCPLRPGSFFSFAMFFGGRVGASRSSAAGNPLVWVAVRRSGENTFPLSVFQACLPSRPIISSLSLPLVPSLPLCLADSASARPRTHPEAPIRNRGTTTVRPRKFLRKRRCYSLLDSTGFSSRHINRSRWQCKVMNGEAGSPGSGCGPDRR